MQTLGIKERAYRNYRRRLQTEFPPFLRPDGTSRIEEVKVGEVKYLRLVDVGEHGWSDADFVARVTALHFAVRLLSFLEGTEIGDAMGAFFDEFKHTLRDREWLLGGVLDHADRMFYEVPAAPKDYSSKGEVIKTIIRAMMLNKRVAVRYQSASLPVDYESLIEPLTLATHRSALYIFARRKGYDDVRMYAVDRFLAAEPTEQNFEYPSRVVYTPEQYVEGSWGIWRGGEGERHEFELVFANKRWLKMFLQERRWHQTQKFLELDDGRLRMTFVVSSDKEVWRWIRGFEDDVEVVAPVLPG